MNRVLQISKFSTCGTVQVHGWTLKSVAILPRYHKKVLNIALELHKLGRKVRYWLKQFAFPIGIRTKLFSNVRSEKWYFAPITQKSFEYSPGIIKNQVVSQILAEAICFSARNSDRKSRKKLTYFCFFVDTTKKFWI